ncbi:MAG: TIGR02281 family clan AA aspartic protease [Gammaproteobacteria bacterium]|nr:TIGR02281 family clan AA aspartic protease [Gammaproteobacteria bacterium]MDX2487251.1 TIGR02281 family clan AA aspartic protease [Gammaproteobacteria bacterium]
MNNSQQQGNRRIGKWMIFSAWLLGFAMVTLYFSYFLEKEQNPNQSVYSRQGESGETEVVLKRNRYGHYVVTGSINAVTVQFMLDTGATDVAIPAKIADKLALRKGPEKRYSTANGMVTAYSTVLDSVSIGPIVIENVRASINPGLKGKQILLGMSVLKRIEFTQRGDTLILKAP